MRPAQRWLLAGLLALAAAAARADVPVVVHGKPAAVIVLAENPTSVSRYAADELVAHLARATGATLAIVREGAEPADVPNRIYLGATRAAQAAGIDVAHLAPETYVLKTAGHNFIITGGDGRGEALEFSVPAGTLFGVYEWLERAVGVRWLWPGDLGTYVPHTDTITAVDVNDTAAPPFVQRQTRGGLTFKSQYPALGFTEDAFKEYGREQAVFLRRHRMGKTEKMVYGHAFTDWWKKYGAEHPEWFQLVNGKRGPTKPGGSYSMCVSNPEFQHKIVELWQERRAKNHETGPSYLNVVENGIMGLCECDNCRALDGPQPADFLEFYSPRSKMMGSRYVTDRYVKFWLAVQAEARKTDPEVTLIVYNYFNYFYAPSPGTKLNDHIIVGSYPSSGWYPRSAEETAWYERQWRAWQATGAQLFSRGNYCLDGYCMPYIFAHSFAREFKFQVACGMMATDYDAITGQWAAQGPNLYLLVRLQEKPHADADQLLAEYYSAFGAAAPEIRAYFDYWENYATERRAATTKIFDDADASHWRSWPKVADEVFPAASFAPAEAILTRAAAAVKGDDEAVRRVEFIRLGLVHAKLCAQAASCLSLTHPEGDAAQGRKVLAELIAFRRAHERENIGNFNHSAWLEDASWRLPAELKQKPAAYDRAAKTE